MRSDRRRDRRMKENEENPISLKKTLYIAGTILALGIIAFVVTIMVYNNSVDKLYADLETTKGIAEMKTANTTEEASANLGKTIDDIQEEIQETSVENEEIKETVVGATEESNQEESNNASSNVAQNSNKGKSDNSQEGKKTEEKTETKKTLSFIMPVDGDVQKEYAKDKLVYSETLKEWVTHTGIDIKAAKTSVVKASEEGTVTAIKNDPRYGTTVIIEHSDGYETRYANLLTAEFVSIGEHVDKGQTIGTVGDTGSFEILDDPHVHFEILKDGEYQDPTSIIK